MFQNRISGYFESDSPPAWASNQMGSHATTRQAVGMVMVPAAMNASWQGELYRRAYEQAVIDLEPPRHQGRYFSVWN